MSEIIFKSGDKVKINVDAFDWQRNTLTEKFLDFIDNNIDTIFTLKEYSSNSNLWTFEEDSLWLLYEDNLIKIEE